MIDSVVIGVICMATLIGIFKSNYGVLPTGLVPMLVVILTLFGMIMLPAKAKLEAIYLDFSKDWAEKTQKRFALIIFVSGIAAFFYCVGESNPSFESLAKTVTEQHYVLIPKENLELLPEHRKEELTAIEKEGRGWFMSYLLIKSRIRGLISENELESAISKHPEGYAIARSYLDDSMPAEERERFETRLLAEDD